MIVFHSMGGLGNQLFQYATARRLALALDTDVAADTSWHRRRLPNTTPRPFELTRLDVRLTPLPGRERLAAKAASHFLLHRLTPLLPWTVVRERGFAFDPSVLALGDRPTSTATGRVRATSRRFAPPSSRSSSRRRHRRTPIGRC